MKKYSKEDTKHVQSSKNNQENPLTGEPRVLLIAFTAALGFLSIGYHLSVLNSVSIYIYFGLTQELEYHHFKSFVDLALPIAAGILCGIFAFSNIKFAFYRQLLFTADFLMILGTILTFGLYYDEFQWILLGRIITGLAIGINIAYVLPFIKEVQFHLSESFFKVEQRRFFVELLFSFGVLFGYLPSHLPLGISEHGDYTQVEKLAPNGSIANPGEFLKKPQTWVCVVLALVPLIASVTRIGLLTFIGEVKSPHYCSVDQGNENPRKLARKDSQEADTLLKLLQQPYRRKVELCYFLFILQLVAGFMIFLVNPMYVANEIKNFSPLDDVVSRDVQFTILMFGSIFCGANILGSLLFTFAKIPRRAVLGFGSFLGIISALALLFLNLWKYYTWIKFALYFYWASICIGMGPAIELIAEELIPGKGFQLITSIKWLLIGGLGFIIKPSLMLTMTYIPLYYLFLGIIILSSYLVYDLLPETANLHLNEMYKLYDEEDENQGAVELISNENERGSKNCLTQ